MKGNVSDVAVLLIPLYFQHLIHLLVVFTASDQQLKNVMSIVGCCHQSL
jgi:hypothetical protein